MTPKMACATPSSTEKRKSTSPAKRSTETWSNAIMILADSLGQAVRVCARAAWSESGTEQAASSVEPTAARPVAARTHIDGSKVLEREHYESI